MFCLPSCTRKVTTDTQRYKSNLIQDFAIDLFAREYIIMQKKVSDLKIYLSHAMNAKGNSRCPQNKMFRNLYKYEMN